MKTRTRNRLALYGTELLLMLSWVAVPSPAAWMAGLMMVALAVEGW